ncbi:MAG: hypothetical protein Alpg2KO_19140 [Alphaproteobacteria bacterium]
MLRPVSLIALLLALTIPSANLHAQTAEADGAVAESSDPDAEQAVQEEGGPGDMIQVILSREDLSMFQMAVEAAGLTAQIREADGYTIFAPSNAAFAKLRPDALMALLAPENRGRLKSILSHHILRNEVTTSEVTGAYSPINLRNRQLSMQGGEPLTLGPAKVVAGDLKARNGIIHIIDRLVVTE